MIKSSHEMNDQLGSIESKLKNVQASVLDMPSQVKPWLEKIHTYSQEAANLKTSIFGDVTKARREFETAPTFNDRIGNIAYSLWNSTAAVPGAAAESLKIAEKQFLMYQPQVSQLHQKVESLIRDVEKAGGPYIGR